MSNMAKVTKVKATAGLYITKTVTFPGETSVCDVIKSLRENLKLGTDSQRAVINGTNASEIANQPIGNYGDEQDIEFMPKNSIKLG